MIDHKEPDLDWLCTSPPHASSAAEAHRLTVLGEAVLREAGFIKRDDGTWAHLRQQAED